AAEEALRYNRKQPALLSLQARIALHTGDEETGEKALADALDQFPYSDDLHNILLQNASYAVALRVLNELENKCTDAHGPHFRIASSYEELGQRDRAIQLLQRVTKYPRCDFASYDMLARIYVESQQPVKA